MVPGSPGINDQIGWKRCDSNVFQVPGSGFQVPPRCAGNNCSLVVARRVALCFLLVNKKRFSPQRHKDTKSI